MVNFFAGWCRFSQMLIVSVHFISGWVGGGEKEVGDVGQDSKGLRGWSVMLFNLIL